MAEGDGESEIADHLKDSVEGNLRLKRMLSEDGLGKDPKKRKLLGSSPNPMMQSKINMIAQKWGGMDAICKHVLEGMTVQEMNQLMQGTFWPDPNHHMRSPGEQLARHLGDMREKELPGNMGIDPIAAFKFRFKVDILTEKKIRALSAKDLRHVMEKYDGVGVGKKTMDMCIKEAAQIAPEEGRVGDNVVGFLGPITVSRLHRLELIDPLADSAVFGDANLTFAMRLASHRKALGHAGRVIATTFEDLDTLRTRYKEIDQSIKTLEDHSAEVYHGVDCTRIAIDDRFQGLEESLGAVYYNFPHSGAIQGFFDGHPVVNWRHENLMRLFFRALRSFVKSGGFVKVSSNATAVGVRYSYIVASALENEFVHVETVPFTEWHLHRYGRSYGDKRDVYKRPDAKNNQSYNAQAAEKDMVYCFCFKPSGNKIPPQTVRMPPTLETLCACPSGPFLNLQPVARQNLAKQLHQRFLTEISGVHVG